MRADWTILVFCAVISFAVSLSVSLLSKQDKSDWEQSTPHMIDAPLTQNTSPTLSDSRLPPHLSGGGVDGHECHELRDDCIRRLLIGAAYDKSGYLTSHMADVVRQQCQP